MGTVRVVLPGITKLHSCSMKEGLMCECFSLGSSLLYTALDMEELGRRQSPYDYGWYEGFTCWR